MARLGATGSHHLSESIGELLCIFRWFRGVHDGDGKMVPVGHVGRLVAGMEEANIGQQTCGGLQIFEAAIRQFPRGGRACRGTPAETVKLISST